MKSFFEIYANESKVGELKIFDTNANKTYSFVYDENWLKFGFELDPNLLLHKGEFVSQNLWGAFVISALIGGADLSKTWA